MIEHGALEGDQLWSRVETEFLGEHSPGPLERMERVRGATGPVVAGHDGRPCSFVERFPGHGPLRRDHRLVEPTELEEAVDQLDRRRRTRLLDRWPRRLDERHRIQPVERTPPPHRERRGEQARRPLGLPARNAALPSAT